MESAAVGSALWGRGAALLWSTVSAQEWVRIPHLQRVCTVHRKRREQWHTNSVKV